MKQYDVLIRTGQRSIISYNVASIKATEQQVREAKYVALLASDSEGVFYSVLSRIKDKDIVWQKVTALDGHCITSALLTYSDFPTDNDSYLNILYAGLKDLPFKREQRPQAICIFKTSIERNSFVLTQQKRFELIPSDHHFKWGSKETDKVRLYSLIANRNPYSFSLPDGQHLAYDINYTLAGDATSVLGKTICGIPAMTLLLNGARWRLGAADLDTLNCPNCLASIRTFQKLYPKINVAGCNEYPTNIKAKRITISKIFGLYGWLDWCFNCYEVTRQIETMPVSDLGLFQQCGNCGEERPLGKKTRY